MDNVLGYADTAVFEEYLYYCSFFFNGFFRENVKTHETEFLTFLPGNEKWDSELTGDVVCRNSSIIVFPVKSRGIYEYDVESEKIFRIYDPGLWGDGFGRALRMDDAFLLVPINIRDRFLLYKDNRELLLADDINNLVKQILEGENELYVDGFGACIHDNVLYIALSQSEWLIKIELRNKRIKKINIKGSALRNLLIIGNDLWIVSDSVNRNKASAIRLDLNTDNYRRYELPGIEDHHSCYGFSEYKDSLLAFEYEGDHIWIFDKDSDEWRVFAYSSEYPVGFDRAREGYPLFFAFFHMDNKLLLLPSGGNGTITIDEHTDEMSFQPSLIPDDFLENSRQIEKNRRMNILEKSYSADGGGLLLEGSDVDINDYIEFLQ